MQLIELREMGLTWGAAQKMEKDQDRWRRIVTALWLTRGEDYEQSLIFLRDSRVGEHASGRVSSR